MRARLALCFVASASAAYTPPRPPPFRFASAAARSRQIFACAPLPERNGHSHHELHGQHVATAGDQQHAGLLLDALDCWLRSQTIESVLPREQAKLLLNDLRDDRRFWAQQRKQFNVLWISIEDGMRQEDRKLGDVLGPVTSARLELWPLLLAGPAAGREGCAFEGVCVFSLGSWIVCVRVG